MGDGTIIRNDYQPWVVGEPQEFPETIRYHKLNSKKWIIKIIKNKKVLNTLIKYCQIGKIKDLEIKSKITGEWIYKFKEWPKKERLPEGFRL
jgi:hypothetical protein